MHKVLLLCDCGFRNLAHYKQGTELNFYWLNILYISVSDRFQIRSLPTVFWMALFYNIQQNFKSLNNY